MKRNWDNRWRRLLKTLFEQRIEIRCFLIECEIWNSLFSSRKHAAEFPPEIAWEESQSRKKLPGGAGAGAGATTIMCCVHAGRSLVCEPWFFICFSYAKKKKTQLEIPIEFSAVWHATWCGKYHFYRILRGAICVSMERQHLKCP